MGLSEREAALCTMREYLLRSDGFTRALRTRYEHMRWMVWQMMMPHFKRGQAPKDPRTFLRFGWEEMTEEEAEEIREGCAMTAEEVDELNRLVTEHHKRVCNNG